jgi:hypothetical protein
VVTGSRSIRRGAHRLIAVAVSAFLLSTMLMAALPASSALAADPPGCVRARAAGLLPHFHVERPSPLFATVGLGTTTSVTVAVINPDSVECGPSTFTLATKNRRGSHNVLAKFAVSTVVAYPGVPKRLKVYLSTTARAKVGSAAWFDARVTDTSTRRESGTSPILKVTVVP